MRMPHLPFLGLAGGRASSRSTWEINLICGGRKQEMIWKDMQDTRKEYFIRYDMLNEWVMIGMKIIPPKL